jgi:hypothetical protein
LASSGLASPPKRYMHAGVDSLLTPCLPPTTACYQSLEANTTREPGHLSCLFGLCSCHNPNATPAGFRMHISINHTLALPPKHHHALMVHPRCPPPPIRHLYSFPHHYPGRHHHQRGMFLSTLLYPKHTPKTFHTFCENENELKMA